MGFVKSAEEIDRIEYALRNPRFTGAQALTVEFLSDPDVIASILPPPLEPGDSPSVRVMVGRWQSNCVGDFAGGSVKVSARHEGVEGLYVLAMYMDSDVPTIYGRDLYGEPKKVGRFGLFRRGDHFRAWIERGGVRLVELSAELRDDTGPFEAEHFNFNFKARPAANGVGLEEDAILTRAHSALHVTASRKGPAEISLRGTVHDPLDELPIESVVGATYIEGDQISSNEAIATVPAGDFLPFHYGRQDDWSALDTEAAVLPSDA